MSAQDTEFDREIAKLLRPAGVPPVDARTMWLAEFSLEPDGPIRQPTHDGSVRRYAITEAGRVAASAVLP
jgi:hypothetical protein